MNVEQKMLPKVSVFLPTYNQRHFLDETIESILVQDYPNLEIVVGDDGSTDGSQELLQEYVERYPGLFKLILSPVNTGITANCNRIIFQCDGDYVAMFAGDDLWLPGKIKKQIEVMEKNPECVLCYTDVEMFDNHSNMVLDLAPKIGHDHNKCDLISFAYTLGNCGCSFVVRKAAIPESGFNSKLPNVSDWLFWIEILMHGNAVYINETLARYRRHENNTSLNYNIIAAEHLMTLALVELKYPMLSQYAQKYREGILDDVIKRRSMSFLLIMVYTEFRSRLTKKFKRDLRTRNART